MFGVDQSSVASAEKDAGANCSADAGTTGVPVNFGAVASYSAVTIVGFWSTGKWSTQTAAAFPCGSTATWVESALWSGGDSVAAGPNTPPSGRNIARATLAGDPPDQTSTPRPFGFESSC